MSGIWRKKPAGIEITQTKRELTLMIELYIIVVNDEPKSAKGEIYIISNGSWAKRAYPFDLFSNHEIGAMYIVQYFSILFSWASMLFNRKFASANTLKSYTKDPINTKTTCINVQATCINVSNLFMFNLSCISNHYEIKAPKLEYCISRNFREAFIFANFANEFTNAKIKAHKMSHDHSHSWPTHDHSRK